MKATLTQNVSSKDLQLHIPRKIVIELGLQKGDELSMFLNDKNLIIGKDLPSFIKFLNWCINDNEKTEQ